ncbi:hypothetical protein L916_12873, partial [Phytophthora nicotianae]
GYPGYSGYESASSVGADDGKKESATEPTDAATTKLVEKESKTESKAKSSKEAKSDVTGKSKDK